jgi:hypothetical protein
VRRQGIASSSLASVGYDGRHAVLEVEFRSGAVYRYFAVPNQVFQELLAATSKGAFLNRRIRDRFPYARL